MPTIISWTKETWNPITGCSKISSGCRNCYAERLALKFGWSTLPWTEENASANIVFHPSRLRKPKAIKKPSMIFTNSMSDMWHQCVPKEHIEQIFLVMGDTPQHTYQILTKRPARAASWTGPWTPNIWQGVSVENRSTLTRIDQIKPCPASVKFVSFEPLLEDIGSAINLDGIDWVIVGGESGPGHRPMDHAWARNIRDACVEQGVAFYFKQSAAHRTEIGTSLIHEDGSRWYWRQFPGNLTPPILADGI